jgi:hypothetical protein
VKQLAAELNPVAFKLPAKSIVKSCSKTTSVSIVLERQAVVHRIETKLIKYFFIL